MATRNDQSIAAHRRLEAIERWSRRTFYAAAIAAACLVPVGAWYLYWEVQAVRLAMALAASRPEAAAPREGGLEFDAARGIGDLKRSILGGGRD